MKVLIVDCGLSVSREIAVAVAQLGHDVAVEKQTEFVIRRFPTDDDFVMLKDRDQSMKGFYHYYNRRRRHRR